MAHAVEPVITITGAEQHAAWQRRELPQVEEVRPNLWSLPITIPNNPLRYVFCYAFASDNELVLVDPGWPADEAWNQLVDRLAMMGAAPKDVTGVLVTHAHPDHLGLAPRLRETSGAWVALHSAEQAELARIQDRDFGRPWVEVCGIPEEQLGEWTREGHPNAGFQADVLLEHNDRAPVKSRDVRAIWTPGHTPGHVCFSLPDDDALLTGDHVLPRISPNISIYSEHAPDALGKYLQSLEETEAFDVEALPGHEYRFRNIPARARQIAEHHEERLHEIERALTKYGQATAWQVAAELTWSRAWSEYTGGMLNFAVSETYAHLHHMVATGRVVVTDGLPALWSLAR